MSSRRFKKILEIGPIAPPLQGWSVRIQYVRKSMQQAGVRCGALDVGENRRMRRPNCDTVGSPFSYAWKVFWYLCRGYRLHTHLNGQSIKAYCLVLFSTVLSFLFFRRSVLTWHAGVQQKYFPKSKSRFWNLVNRIVFRLSHCIICNDKEVKTRIAAYGVDPRRIFPIPAFSRQYLDFRPAQLPQNLARFLDGSKPRIFCYLAFRPEFAIDVLVSGLRELLQSFCRLGVVIASCGSVPKQIRDQFVNAGLDERHVWFAGNLERAMFLTVLSQSDVCVRTPERDGISSFVLESLALGVPVVAAANSLRPPQVFQYRGDDAQDLANNVRDVLRMPIEQRTPEPPVIPDSIADEIDILTGVTTTCRNSSGTQQVRVSNREIE